ncbi:MAG: metal-dependent hydrolase [Planctomycetaceae bacterium]
MTLPEHAVCSLMIAQAGVRERFGTRGVLAVTVAGISPDLDTAAKLVSDDSFWRLHHALGHSLLSITVLAVIVAAVSCRCSKNMNFRPVFGWCLIAAFVHCLTDSLYWWGVQPLWPFSEWEVCFEILEYLDLIVLSIWFGGAVWLWRKQDRPRAIAMTTLGIFSGYVVLRAWLPAPQGIFQTVTGGWMYDLPSGTIFDWW